MGAAVDVVAIPSTVYIDPIMDKAVAAIPIWLWVLLVVLIAIIGSNFWWIYKRMVMAPVLGYLEAFKHGQPQTIFLGKNRAFKIKYLEYIDSVLAYKELSEISKWLVQSPKSVGRLGGLSTLIVRDNYDYSVDPIAEIAICTLAKEWNINHEEHPINNYNDFNNLRLSGKLETEYPDGIPIPLYNVYDPSLIQKYLPQGRSAGIFGSHLMEKARSMRIDKSQEKWYEKYVPIGIVVSVSLIILVLSYMYASGGF